jgi:hypothetical protein
MIIMKEGITDDHITIAHETGDPEYFKSGLFNLIKKGHVLCYAKTPKLLEIYFKSPKKDVISIISNPQFLDKFSMENIFALEVIESDRNEYGIEVIVHNTQMFKVLDQISQYVLDYYNKKS